MKKVQAADQQINSKRRSFLRTGAVVGGSVAGATGLAGKAIAADEVPEAETREEGYRMTRHIAEYYKTAKL